MQHAQNQWIEQQRQLSHARDDALMSRLITETSRSMGMLVSQLLTGLGTLLQQPFQPQPMFTPSQPQPMYTPYNNTYDNYGLPPPPHRNPYPNTPQSEGEADVGDQGLRFCQLR